MIIPTLANLELYANRFQEKVQLQEPLTHKTRGFAKARFQSGQTALNPEAMGSSFLYQVLRRLGCRQVESNIQQDLRAAPKILAGCVKRFSEAGGTSKRTYFHM